MLDFMLSSAITFIIYEFLAFIHFPSVTVTRIHLKEIWLTLDEATAQSVNTVVRVLIVLIAFILIFLVHDAIPPLGWFYRNRSAIAVGFIFGPLFAIWINNIVTHPPGENLSRTQTATGVGLILLFIMGSFGNEIGDLIQRYARSIKELKLAGAEFSFTERSQQQGDPALGSTPLAGNARAYLSPGDLAGFNI